MASRSYRMMVDRGHAPCPFDNLLDLVSVNNENCHQIGSKILSLSTCTKNTRAGADEKDWVLGIAGADFGEQQRETLVWAGKVSKKLSKSAYFYEDYLKRISKSDNPRRGYNSQSRPDNYYCMDYAYDAPFTDILGISEGHAMFKNPFHNLSDKTDLQPPTVLLFHEFWYFGANASVKVPCELRAERQEAKIIEAKDVKKFIAELKKEYPEPGVYGPPMHLDCLREDCVYTWREHIKHWMKENWRV